MHQIFDVSFAEAIQFTTCHLKFNEEFISCESRESIPWNKEQRTFWQKKHSERLKKERETTRKYQGANREEHTAFQKCWLGLASKEHVPQLGSRLATCGHCLLSESKTKCDVWCCVTACGMWWDACLGFSPWPPNPYRHGPTTLTQIKHGISKVHK